MKRQWTQDELAVDDGRGDQWLGRTGRLFAAEHFDVVPDILVMAKGLSSDYMPIAATVVGPDLYSEFKEHAARLTHLLTFGGHAVACAVALNVTFHNYLS